MNKFFDFLGTLPPEMAVEVMVLVVVSMTMAGVLILWGALA